MSEESKGAAGAVGRETAGIESSSARRWDIVGLLQAYGLWLLIVMLLIAAAIVTPGYLQPGRLMLLLRQAVPLGILSVGQLFVLLVSGLDLSVGQLVSMVAVIAGMYITGASDRILPAVLLVTGIALVVGLVNGIVITKRRVEPFIMTLAMALILQGFLWNYTGGAKLGQATRGFRQIALGYAGPVPIAVIIWIAIVALAALLLHRTAFGRQVFAIGGNREAARLSGVHVDAVVIACYVICALSALLAGLMLLAYVGVSDPASGSGYELGSIAAAVVGGASLAGGIGTIRGNVAGVLVLTLVGSLLNAFTVPFYSGQIARGVIIIAAVAWYMRSQHQVR